MKNRIILMAAAVAAMMVSCQKEEISTPVVKTEPVVITAGVETKTMLDGNSVKWTDGDQVAVFSRANDSGDYTQSSNTEFKAKDINGNKANFKGNVVEGTKTFYAIYPYEKAVNVSGNTVTVKVPGGQTPTANTFAEEHNISVAKVTKNPGEESVEGEFKNVLALIKFTIPENVDDATSVTITADQNIVGNLAINFGSENPTYTVTTNGSQSASMEKTSMENKGGFTNNTFWFVVAPVHIKTLTVSVATENNGTYQMTKNWGDEGYLLEAGKYINLGTLEMRQVVAAANHNYDDNGVLTGTQLTITLPEVDKNKTIQSTNFVVTKDDVAVTGWDKIDAPTLVYAKPSSYPYLPQGTYKISGTYTTNKGVTYSISESEFVVGAPFSKDNPLSANHDVYTSYTLYQRSKETTRSEDDRKAHLKMANKDCDPMTIYCNKNVVPTNIDKSIYSNEAYKGLIKWQVQVGDNDPVANEVTVSEKGEYSVKNIYVFDGVESVSNPITCHITGLPYSYKFSDKATEQIKKDGWVITSEGGEGVTCSSQGLEGLKIGSLRLLSRTSTGGIFSKKWTTHYGYVVSPKFHVPASINVLPTVARYGLDLATLDKAEFTGYVGPVENQNTKSTALSYSINTSILNGDTYEVTGITDPFGTFEMSSKTQYVSLGCNDFTKNITAYFLIYNVKFEYAE